MQDQRLHRLAARQLGLFTRADAARCGFSEYQVRRRIHVGEWQRVYGKVLAHRARTVTPMVLAAAAHLAVPGSVVAGPSAALWYGLPVGAAPVRWLWTGPGGRGSVADVRILRDPLAKADIRRADGIPITGPGRTIFDCLRILPEDTALNVLDRALQQGWTTRGELATRAEEHAARHGTARAIRLLATAGGYRSAAERMAGALLRSAGITGWGTNVEIYDHAGLIGYGDIVFRSARLVIEIDGWAFHSDRDSFQRDRTRQNRLVAAGWTVLRFTWNDLKQRPDDFVAAVRRMINFSGRNPQ
jgi:hypothetical protein